MRSISVCRWLPFNERRLLYESPDLERYTNEVCYWRTQKFNALKEPLPFIDLHHSPYEIEFREHSVCGVCALGARFPNLNGKTVSAHQYKFGGGHADILRCAVCKGASDIRARTTNQSSSECGASNNYWSTRFLCGAETFIIGSVGSQNSKSENCISTRRARGA